MTLTSAQETHQLHGKKVLFLVNSLDYFHSHRFELAQRLVELGLKVKIVASPGGDLAPFVKASIPVIAISLKPLSKNPFTELLTLIDIFRIYKREGPDLVHHITIKPVLYGSLVARVLGVPAVVNTVPGRGVLFGGAGIFATAKRLIVTALYRISVPKRGTKMIFQTSADREDFIARKIVSTSDAVLIRGAGIDFQNFLAPIAVRNSPVRVLFAARLLKSKGVFEFLAAVSKLRQREGVAASFLLAGEPMPEHPDGISEQQIVAACSSAGVEYLGRVKEMAALLKVCDIVVIPSRYPEGVPKFLLEALAAGCAVLARQFAAVEELFVPNKEIAVYSPNNPLEEPKLIAAGILTLIENQELRLQIAASGQKRIIENSQFSAQEVVNSTVNVYLSLL